MVFATNKKNTQSDYMWRAHGPDRADHGAHTKPARPAARQAAPCGCDAPGHPRPSRGAHDPPAPPRGGAARRAGGGRGAPGGRAVWAGDAPHGAGAPREDDVGGGAGRATRRGGGDAARGGDYERTDVGRGAARGEAAAEADAVLHPAPGPGGALGDAPRAALRAHACMR